MKNPNIEGDVAMRKFIAEIAAIDWPKGLPLSALGYFVERARQLSSEAEKGSVTVPSGVDIIATERRRQIEVEGWTAEHDDRYRRGELAAAAACYAVGRPIKEFLGLLGGGPHFDSDPRIEQLWPWDRTWWKPSRDAVNNYVKAGALCAAAIDQKMRKRRSIGW